MVVVLTWESSWGPVCCLGWLGGGGQAVRLRGAGLSGQAVALWLPRQQLHACRYFHLPCDMRQLPLLNRRYTSGVESAGGQGDVCCCWGGSGHWGILGGQPNSGRCGLLGHAAATWSSSRQYEHLGTSFALPVKASWLGTDQSRLFSARASFLKRLS